MSAKQTPAGEAPAPAPSKHQEIVIMGETYVKHELAAALEHVLEMAIFRSEDLSENDTGKIWPVWQLFKSART